MPIVLVPIYNHIVFFRFFEDVSHIDKVFYFFRNIAADKSVPYAVDFPHRAIKNYRFFLPRRSFSPLLRQ